MSVDDAKCLYVLFYFQMRLLSWTFIPIAKPFARFKFHSFVRETRLRSPQRKTGFQRRRLLVLLAVYEFKQRNT